MTPITDPNNFGLLMMLTGMLGIPEAILTVLLFLGFRLVPNRWIRVFLPLCAGVIVLAIYSAGNPPKPEDPMLPRFILGSFIHPLLALPPIMILAEYLRRIPPWLAAFLTGFFSFGLLLVIGMASGDVRPAGQANLMIGILISTGEILIPASAVAGLIFGLDRILSDFAQNSSGQPRK